jgi:hypothetical protein
MKYNFGYMYSYSERPGTLAGRKMEDDVRRNQSTKITGNCRLATKNTPGCAPNNLLGKS